MKLTHKEIQEQKALFGSEAVNFFVRFMDARKRWKRLPDYFIKQVIENSDDLPTYRNTGEANSRQVKRKTQNYLANRAIAISSGAKGRAKMGKGTNKEI